MKSSSAAVTSFACLFAIINLCYGLECYTCISYNYANEECEKINPTNEKIVLNYNKTATYCVKYVASVMRHGKVFRLLNRYGHGHYEHLKIARQALQQTKEGFKVDFRSCRENRCNYW